MSQGGALLVKQLTSMMTFAEYSSQGDSTMSIGALRYFAKFAALQQRYSESLFSSIHQGKGKATSSSCISWNKFQAYNFIICRPAMGEKYWVMNSPLSGMAQTLAFFAFQTRQFEQRQVPIPPAETPVKTMVSALQKSNCLSKKQNCSIVLLYPRKYNFLSLQEMGSTLLPVYQLPSQYFTHTLVQSQNTGFIDCRVDSKPNLSIFLKGGSFFDDPKLPLLLRQQLSSVYWIVLPSQNPPLSKQIMNLFLFSPFPSWQYRLTGVPSRQRAPRSQE